MSRVLIVDDEPALRFALREVLEERGDDVDEADSGEKALSLTEGESFDVVLTDLVLGGMTGLELLAQLKESQPALPVILLTARGSERTAVQALRAGAWDYLTKPFDNDEVCAAIGRAAEVSAAKREAQTHAARQLTGGRVIGSSPPFQQLLRHVDRLAPRDVTILLRGETGTGKELIAALLHAGSSRRQQPLVRFNCAALPSELAEAELFGHRRGAFTGATSDQPGYFQRADRGTLVLDEVAELPLSLQPKLLRALQSGETQPVGARAPNQVDVRVIASTHKNLLAEAQAGRFREDLYYRLAVVELEVPPLRSRREDIPALAEELRRRAAERFDLPQHRLPQELLDRFAAYGWPGNVRELENTVTRLLALSSDGRVDATQWRGETSPASSAEPEGLRERLAVVERDILEQALRETAGNQSEAARRLRVTRTTLLDKLKKHGLR